MWMFLSLIDDVEMFFARLISILIKIKLRRTKKSSSSSKKSQTYHQRQSKTTKWLRNFNTLCVCVCASVHSEYNKYMGFDSFRRVFNFICDKYSFCVSPWEPFNIQRCFTQTHTHTKIKREPRRHSGLKWNETFLLD